MFVSIPLQGKLAKTQQKHMKRAIRGTDVRSKHVNELLNGIKMIKMCAPSTSLPAVLHARRVVAIRLADGPLAELECTTNINLSSTPRL